MSAKLIQPTPSAYQFPLLIKHLLQTPLLYAPDQEIRYRDQACFTYTEFGERVNRLADGLKRIGVEPGDTVAVMDWDSHRYLECFFAVPMMGAVLHTINVRLSSEQLVYTINHAEDDVILVNEEFLPLLEPVKDQLSTVKKIILMSDTQSAPDTSLMIDTEYEAMLAASAAGFDFPDLDENTQATTFYTTGTTGLPKGVCFSHRQLVLHTYAVITALSGHSLHAGVTAADVYMPITPMFHVHAWGMPYVMTLLGAKQVYPGRYEPEMLLRLKQQEKVTFSHCVPTILHLLVNNPAVKEVDCSGWKVIIGGSALPQGLCRTALALGINVYTGYGMSETCPVLSLALLTPEMLSWAPEKQIMMRCRTGLPITNVQWELWDGEGRPLPPDGKSTGELVVRAPWLTQGYGKDPDKSEALWHNGWLHTGDIGFIDALGYLQITDRLKDVIKTGGEWVSSLELEDIISRHPAVSEVAVIGVPDTQWGERPVALVVLKPDLSEPVDGEALKAFVMQYATDGVIPKYGVPDRVMMVEALPKTSVGKQDKKVMRRQFQ